MTPRGPVRWLHGLRLRRPRPEESVAWEIEHHISELTDRLVEEGWSDEAAGAEARLRFGDPERYAPPMRRMERGRMAMERRTQWVDLVAQSGRSLARSARRYPGFTVAVVLTLALGIGANATMYSIVDRLLLQPPLYVANADQVQRVYVERQSPLTGDMILRSELTYPDYADFKAHTGIEAVAAYSQTYERTIGSGAAAARARVTLATAELFPLVGVKPVRGRFFTPEESRPGQPLTAVISATHWEAAYGRDPDILGRVVEINGNDHTIVGVAPRGFTGMSLEATDFWAPLEATHVAWNGEASCLDSRGCWWIDTVMRLKSGVTIQAVEAEATRLHINGRRDRIDQGRYSDRAHIVLGSAIAAKGPRASDEARVARWLMGVSLLVLIIACANVANLLMARGTQRRRETSVRLAMGAPRRRVVGQLVGESVLLSLVGGVAALALAHWGGALVRKTLLPGVYFPNALANGRVLGFTALAALAAGVAAAVGPALQGARTEIAGALSEASRGNAGSGSRFRSFLTVTQAALSVVLLVGAGLFVQSLRAVHHLDVGLDVDHLVTARLELRSSDLPPAEKTALYEEAMRRVSNLRGVRSVAASAIPFGGGYATSLRVPGLDSLPTLPGGGPYYYPVSPDYFETMGLEILSGRPITSADGADGAKVAVVSETTARIIWAGADPLGGCLMVGRTATECTTVVGVVQDANMQAYREEVAMSYYLPAAQIMPYDGLFLRTAGDPGAMVEPVSEVLRSLSGDVRYARVRTIRDAWDPQARAWKLGATMFSTFGLLALLLASIGLYSVLAFNVAQRTRELGIRTALGAEKYRLLGSVLYQGARLAILGVLVGLGGAYLAAPWVGDLLFQVSPRDPRVLAGVAVVLGAVSVLASLVPGVRATRVDPMDALRIE